MTASGSRLTIPSSVMAQLRAHLAAGYPNEACGVLIGQIAGNAYAVREFRPMRNVVADRPHDRYRFDDLEHLRVQRDAEGRGLEIIGIVHSHPDHPARPSDFDTNWAMDSRDSFNAYVVARVDHAGVVEARAFRLSLERARFEEEPLHIL